MKSGIQKINLKEKSYSIKANNPFEARLNAENQGATNISFVTPSQVLNNPFNIYCLFKFFFCR